MKYHLHALQDIDFDFSKVNLVFLRGDLGSGKTTFMKNILQSQFGITDSITSPTYTYYNKYGENIYHFDLYRLQKYDEFFAIGGEEILDSDTISFVEWPGLLEGYYKPDVEIFFEKCDDEMYRNIKIIERK